MGIIDVIVIILYMCGLIGVGIYANTKVKTKEDYVLGGKHFGTVSLTSTVMATMMGSGMVIGMISNAYNKGIAGSVIWAYAGMGIGMFVIAACAKKVRDTDALSFAEIIGKKFGMNSRIIAAIFVVLYSIGILCINIAGLRSILAAVFANYNLSDTVLTVIATMVSVLYTSFGGFFAVVWTDSLQFLIMVCFVFILGPILALSDAGGMANVVEVIAAKGGSMTTPVFSTGMLGLALSYFLASPGDPTMPQRVLAGKDLKSVKTAFNVSGVVSFLVIISLTVFGAAIAVALPELGSADTAVTAYVLSAFPPVVKGLTIAALMAAVMSSFDSFLVMGTTHLLYDIVAPLKPGVEEKTLNKIQKVTVVIFGIITMFIALKISSVLGALNVIFSVLGAITVPAITAALFFPDKASKAGVIGGMITGAVVPTYLFFTKGYDVWLGDPIFLGLISAIVVLIVFSVIFKDKK